MLSASSLYFLPVRVVCELLCAALCQLVTYIYIYARQHSQQREHWCTHQSTASCCAQQTITLPLSSHSGARLLASHGLCLACSCWSELGRASMRAADVGLHPAAVQGPPSRALPGCCDQPTCALGMGARLAVAGVWWVWCVGLWVSCSCGKACVGVSWAQPWHGTLRAARHHRLPHADAGVALWTLVCRLVCVN